MKTKRALTPLLWGITVQSRSSLGGLSQKSCYFQTVNHVYKLVVVNVVERMRCSISENVSHALFLNKDQGLTCAAAFSDKKRLRVDGWSPEDQMAAAEQQTVDGLTNLLEAATLAISHEQQIRGSVTSGRTEAAVIEEKDEWARHRGCAEVKKSLVNEYNGVAQCIGGMAAQVEENWRFDDEAEERPVRLRRASDEGDTVIVQGETVDVPSSSSVPRTSSTSSAAVEEGAAVPRKETVFGVPTDSKNWLVLHMEATRGIDGKVRAKVTSSGSFHWRGDGRMGLSGLIGALTAAMLRGIDPKDETEWIRRAELIKEAMVLHALEALEDSKLGDTKAAKALKVRTSECLNKPTVLN